MCKSFFGQKNIFYNKFWAKLVSMPITWYEGSDGDGVGNVVGEVIDTMLAMVVLVVEEVVNRSRVCMRVSFSPVRQPLVTQFISNLNHGFHFFVFLCSTWKTMDRHLNCVVHTVICLPLIY